MCRVQGPEMGRQSERQASPLLLPKLYLPWERPRPQQGTPNMPGLCPSYCLWSSAGPNAQPYFSPFHFEASFVGQHPFSAALEQNWTPFPMFLEEELVVSWALCTPTTSELWAAHPCMLPFPSRPPPPLGFPFKNFIFLVIIVCAYLCTTGVRGYFVKTVLSYVSFLCEFWA